MVASFSASNQVGEMMKKGNRKKSKEDYQDVTPVIDLENKDEYGNDLLEEDED